MTTRRQFLAPLALAPVAAWAIWAPGSEDIHSFSRFHLPLDDSTALWRELAGVNTGSAGFGPEFPEAVRSLAGTRVTLKGFMVPLEEGLEHRRFILVANPVGCPACEKPNPATMVHVRTRRPLGITSGPVVVAGTLTLHPLEGLFYHLDGADPRIA